MSIGLSLVGVFIFLAVLFFIWRGKLLALSHTTSVVMYIPHLVKRAKVESSVDKQQTYTELNTVSGPTETEMEMEANSAYVPRSVDHDNYTYDYIAEQ